MIKITSKDNPRLKYAQRLAASARFRKREGYFIAEGLRICMDALKSGAVIDFLFVTPEALKKYPENISEIKNTASNSYILLPELFSKISDTQTPQGILCIIKTLDKTKLFDTIKTEGKYLALEKVQDPNNIGTVLRSAEAFGIDGVVMSEDCCDIFSPKAVRGSMGAVFRVPILIVKSIPMFLKEHSEIYSYAAVVSKKASPITNICFKLPCVAVIGNEGNGLTAETIAECNNSLTIPMNGKAESLNASVAASIIIWEMIK